VKDTEQPVSPLEWYERWGKELAAADKEVQPWHEEGKEIEERFTVECEDNKKRLNLFTINVLTQHALLYGNNLPKVSVDRRHADPADDVARVAGTLLERGLNEDIERSGDTYAQALGLALLNHLIQGMGQCRLRYVAEFEEVPAKDAIVSPDGRELSPAVPATKRKVYECVHVDFVHWKDLRWSPARVWSEVRWVGFGNDMSLEQLRERFGDEIAESVPLAPSDPTAKKEDVPKDPLARARVWEIWDRTNRKVFWYAHGAGALLAVEDDPYSLDRFFPCPEPFFSQVLGTAKLLPTPEFRVARGLYDEIDRLTARISALIDECKAKGVYDAANPALRRLLDEGGEKMVGVDNWAKLAEKAGLSGSVDWLPIEQFVKTALALQQQRMQAKQDLYEVTGLSDIMRGQGSDGVTLGEQELKARFGSVRMQKTQQSFARFATEIQRLKAEIMARLFEPEFILLQANAEYMPEAKTQPDLLQEAAALLKSKRASMYRIEVKPEAVSMQDFAQLRQERTELLEGLVSFLQAMAPMAQQMPGALPHLLRVLQWFVSGLRGSKQIEGVLDEAIQQAEAMAEQAASNPQGQQIDPKMQAAQAKAAGDIAKVQEEAKARVVELQAETAAKEQQEAAQMKYNVQEHALKQQISSVLKPQDNGGMPK
jgi:hypothetical protein